MAGPLRDLLTALLTTVGTYVLVGVALVVSMAVTVGVIGTLASRGYLRVPDAW